MNHEIMTVRWYPRENDLVGGWCVMPADLPPSSGVHEVADVVSEEVARHIADLHNAALTATAATPGTR